MPFSNLGITEATPFDPSQTNVWAATVNTNMTLIDNAVAGVLSLSVAGSSNVVLTTTAGTPNQFRNTAFLFTGVLTGNIVVLWPSGVTFKFTVNNTTTGNHTLALGVNNGSGSPAGTTVTVPQNAIVEVVSDGTNIALVSLAGGGTWTPVDASGGSLTFTSAVGFYRVSAGIVNIWGSYSMPVTADTNPAQITGLPFTSANLGVNLGYQGLVQFQGGGGIPGGGAPNWLIVASNGTNITYRNQGGALITNMNASGDIVNFSAAYPI